MIRLRNPDTAVRSNTAVSFEVHSSCDRSSDLFKNWSQLAQSPMEHPCWLMNWWNVYRSRERETELFLVSLRDGSTTIAISPLYLDGTVLRLLGDGRACTDHLELLIGRQSDSGAFRRMISDLLDWLSSGAEATCWTRIELESIRLDGPTHSVSTRIKNRMLVHQRDAVPTCEINLPKTWDEYLASLSKNHRKRCRRWLREYDDIERMETISTLDSWDCEDAFETLVRLHNERRGDLDQGLFACPDFKEFLKAAFTELSQLEMAEISAIRVDQQILAVELEFYNSTTTFAYQSGLADGGLKYSGGSLSLLRRIRNAIQNGRLTYDLMRGNEAYKFHWDAVQHPTVRLQIRSHTMSGHLSHRSSVLWDSSKQLLKNLRTAKQAVHRKRGTAGKE